MDQIRPTSLSCLALVQFQNTYKDIGKWCLFHPRVCVLELSLALNSPSEIDYNWKPLGYGNNKKQMYQDLHFFHINALLSDGVCIKVHVG